MPGLIELNVNDQKNIAMQAGQIFLRLENSLPRVPWLSSTGQQMAFKSIVSMVEKETDQIAATKDAKEAIIFWCLTLLIANKKSVRLATISVKNKPIYGLSRASQAFVNWYGSELHPSQAVMKFVYAQKMQDMVKGGIPEKINAKVQELSRTMLVNIDEAHQAFEQKLDTLTAKYIEDGLSENDASSKALSELLS